MKLALYPRYSNLFPEEKIPEVDKLLDGLSFELIINVLCFINAQLHLNPFDIVQKTIVEKFIERLKYSIRKNFEYRLNNFMLENRESQILFFAPHINLRFIQDELLKQRPGISGQPDPIQELNIFKAILVYNEMEDQRNIPKISKSQDSDERFRQVVWPFMINQIEYSFKRNIIIYAYKSLLLFEFLTNDNTYKPYIDEYLNKSGSKNYKEFVKHLMGLYINGYNRKTHRFAYRFPPDTLEINPILRQFIINLQEFNPATYIAQKKHLDFRGLRENPIIVFDDKYLCIAEWNFIIEKFHLGLIFDFYQKTRLVDEIPFPDFKSELSLKYSEKKLFMHLFRKAFEKDIAVCYEGDEIPNYHLDFYYRLKNKIALIEFKDEIIPKKTDYKEIIRIINEKFIETFEDGKLKKKGILQLSEMIKSILKNNDFIEKLDKERYELYPIIIYTDKSLSMPGVNRYLNKQFQHQLYGKSHKKFIVHNLVLMDIDFILEYFDSFINEDYEFFDLLDSYNKLIYEKELSLKWMNDINAPNVFNSCFEEIISQLFPRKQDITKGSIFGELINKLGIK